MSDIDFDELDRAVASVLGGTDEPEETKPVDETTEPAHGPGSAAPDAAEPELAAHEKPAPPDEAPQPVKVVAPAAQALHPVAQKPVQRGRFLDMIHPSHDMAPRLKAPALVIPAHRPHVVPTAQPNQPFVSDVVAPNSSSTSAAEPIASPAVVSEPFTEPVASSEPESADAPDHTESPAPAEEPKINQPTDFFAGSPDEDPTKPAEPTSSPFIPDAKVEKRPLGAYSAGDPNSSLPTGDALHDRLVQVESEANIIETAESTIPYKPDPVLTTTPEAVVSVTPETAPADVETDATKDGPNGRTDKPVKHAKGTIIWLTVAIAVVLIGIGVAATLYFVVLK